jgi:hypothetical protein
MPIVEGLSHAATHEERRPCDTGKGLRQMRAARTYLSPNGKLHSLWWITETGEEFKLTEEATSRLGRLACSG